MQGYTAILLFYRPKCTQENVIKLTIVSVFFLAKNLCVCCIKFLRVFPFKYERNNKAYQQANREYFQVS